MRVMTKGESPMALAPSSYPISVKTGCDPFMTPGTGSVGIALMNPYLGVGAKGIFSSSPSYHAVYPVVDGSGHLSMHHAMPGDANCDGVVDVADLTILATNWQGTGKTWFMADFTGDGVVDINDLYLLAVNWQGGSNLNSLRASLGLP